MAVKKQTTKKTTTTKKETTVHNGVSVEVFDTKGKSAGTVTLPELFFGGKINKTLLAQAVRVYLANQRKGSAVTQTRAEVRISTRKIYRQKGTGRARHGAKSAPIFVGGGVAHGPKQRDYSLDFPQKMRKSALISALSAKATDKKITVIDGFATIEPKTKGVAELLEKLAVKGRHMLIVSGETNNVKRAARNIPSITIRNVSNLTAYEVFAAKGLLVMKEAVTEFTKTGEAK